jgi:hypothetical protein
LNRRAAIGGNSPEFRSREPSPVRDIPAPPEVKARLLNATNSYLRVCRLGDCSVIITREFGEWHLSVSHPSRYPRWLEISEAWYRLVPGAKDLTGALILPPLHEYINLNEFCMQVVQIPPREDVPSTIDDPDSTY